MTYEQHIQHIKELILVHEVSPKLAEAILTEAESNMIGAIAILIKNNLI